jgi:NADH dehydrogenase FAD-containing subunit
LKNETQLARESGTPVDVTVVDRKDRFVFLPLLYELATGQASMDEVL